MSNQCASYKKSGQVCADGFVQLLFCAGKTTCDECGKVGKLPYCLRDELPKHFVNEDGSPRLYKREAISIALAKREDF